MKNKLCSIFVPVFAISGALVSNAMKKPFSSSRVVYVSGYIRSGPAGTTCQYGGLCSTTANQLCTVEGVPGGTQLWGKSAVGVCIIELYKPQE